MYVYVCMCVHDHKYTWSDTDVDNSQGTEWSDLPQPVPNPPQP